MTDRKLSSLRGKIHVKHGFPFKGEHFKSSGPYVVLTPGNFHEEGGFKRNAGKDKCYAEPFPEDYLLKNGDVVVAMTEQTDGLLGSMAMIPEDGRFLHNQRLGLVTSLSSDVDVRFLYHLFKTKSVREQIRRSASGSKVKHTSPERIYDVQVQLPPPKAQVAIANILTALDAKIELNQRINAELEGMAKLLYDYWFVQFDFPMTAAQAAALGKPKLAGHPYRSSGGKMIYNETLKRDIPEGWTTMRFDSFCENFDSKRIPLSKAERSKRQGPIPYYGATGVMDFVDDHIFDGEYVLVAEDGSVMDKDGFPIIQFITGKTWVNNHAHVLRANEPRNNEFLLLSIARIPVINIMTGSIQKKITQDNLNGLLLVRPSTELLESFASFAIPIRQQMVNLQKQNQELTALRDWLLPMLMNGQVTVG